MAGFFHGIQWFAGCGDTGRQGGPKDLTIFFSGHGAGGGGLGGGPAQAEAQHSAVHRGRHGGLYAAGVVGIPAKRQRPGTACRAFLPAMDRVGRRKKARGKRKLSIWDKSWEIMDTIVFAKFWHDIDTLPLTNKTERI